MVTNPSHQLLILSQDCITYKQLIEQERLPGLSILATSDQQDAAQIGTDSDILFGEPALISQAINQLTNVQWIQSSWAGVEPLLTQGLRRDYILTNARNVYGALMSEFVFGYLLAIERRIVTRWEKQLKIEWDASPSGSLKGKRIGLMGVGTIGSHLAATARHFGMIVYGYTRQSEKCSMVDQYFHNATIHDFARELDYIIVTLPGTPETKKIVNESFLSALPEKTWLVNIGRGSTIDEVALVHALNTGKLSGAVLDVFSEEPLPKNHPLWHTPNTYITSHTAAKNYPPDIANIFIENYKLFIDRKPLLYIVDFDQAY
jgi:phosphoglycerate dehydrogenase-like enzyme